MNQTLTKLTVSLLLSTTLGVLADDNIITKHTLTLDGAKKVGDAAAAYAEVNGAPGGAITLVWRRMTESENVVSAQCGGDQ
jgi:hypothetical protein